MARCAVARLMWQMGLKGAMRGKVVSTTISDRAAPCPADREPLRVKLRDQAVAYLPPSIGIAG